MARGDGRTFQRGTRWWVSYYVRGHEVREPGGATEKAARAKLRQRLAEIRLGQYVGPDQERLKVRELLDSYVINRRVLGRKSMKKIESAVGHLKARFGDWRAVEVKLRALERYVAQELAAGVAPGTIQTRLAFLASAFNVTRRQEMHRLRPDFPAITVHNARQGFFSGPDFAALYAVLPEPINDVALFGYLTGWRKEEILALGWDRIDRAEGVIRIAGEDSKNGEAGGIAIEGDLATLIARRWEARKVGTYLADRVFHREGKPIVTFAKVWASACVAAGLCRTVVKGEREVEVPTKIFHDFRRTAVRDMINAGVPERVAMTISRHKTRSVFQRYHIVAPAEQLQALQKTRLYRAAQLEQSTNVRAIR